MCYVSCRDILFRHTFYVSTFQRQISHQRHIVPVQIIPNNQELTKKVNFSCE